MFGSICNKVTGQCVCECGSKLITAEDVTKPTGETSVMLCARGEFVIVCPFDYTAVAGSGKVGPVNQINHTSWVAVVTPTDHPKSVRNHCVIDLFVALFVLSLCPFDISTGVEVFVIGLIQISSFFSS